MGIGTNTDDVVHEVGLDNVYVMDLIPAVFSACNARFWSGGHETQFS